MIKLFAAVGTVAATLIALMLAAPTLHTATTIQVVAEPVATGQMVLLPDTLAAPRLQPAAAPALIDDTGSPATLLRFDRTDLLATVPNTSPDAAPVAAAPQKTHCGD